MTVELKGISTASEFIFLVFFVRIRWQSMHLIRATTNLQRRGALLPKSFCMHHVALYNLQLSQINKFVHVKFGEAFLSSRLTYIFFAVFF